MPASSHPASVSASAIVASAVSGYHVLKIVGYSRTKDSTPNGKRICSHPFRVGGHTWHVSYYPGGINGRATGSISMYLVLDDRFTKGVKAQVRISLLDQDGNPVPSCSVATTGTVNFSQKRRFWGHPEFVKRDVLEKSEHLKDDCFSIRFDVTVMKGIHREEMVPSVVVPPSDMHRDFGDLLSSRDGADVKFLVGEKVFSAHRSVLAARSRVFKAELYGPMKESATSDVIRIDDMDAEVFSALLTFMYTDALPEIKKEEDYAMAQHLLVAADRYNHERLKLICEDKLCKHIDTGSAATILALAEQHHCHGLKEACFQFLGSSGTLNAVVKTDGFGYLARNCTSVLKELMSKVFPR
ncbi:hypothetical protein ACP70R_021264 [Stipagrostis hirtigluma subsp. patula]